MNRRAITLLGILAAALAIPPRAAAHRLDEYLQATRVAIDVDTVSLDIGLTPGVSVAPRIIDMVDLDRDGRISDNEAYAYGQRVIASLTLSVDGHAVPVRLLSQTFPALREIQSGVGTIRLSASAAAAVSPGIHRVAYTNAHLPDLSVYLANALLPADDRVRISEQRRDMLQRGLTVDYRVRARASDGFSGSSFATLALLGMLAIGSWTTTAAYRNRIFPE